MWSHLLLLFSLQVSLTADHHKMEAEVSSLRYQLVTEKSRYKQMQIDLQKELNVAFAENTKLSALLDGKVPKSTFKVLRLGWMRARLRSGCSSVSYLQI